MTVPSAPRTRPAGAFRLAGAALLTAAVLTACTDPSPEPEEPLGGEPTGEAEVEEEPTEEPEPEFNDVDVDFAATTLVYHRESLELHQIIQSKAEVPDEVLTLAGNLYNGQTSEVSALESMLESWDATDSPADADPVSEDEVRELGRAAGDEASTLYLESMISHHESTSSLAEDALAEGENPEAQEVARDILTAQQHELTEMRSLLSDLEPASEDEGE